MAQLIVRNLQATLVEALKRRAAEHGRSAEAEHREILREALLSRRAKGLKRHLLGMPAAGADSDFDPARSIARRIDL
jgi:plasmid stability protein